MLARLDNYYMIPVPFDVGDFYISGTGFLCARTPQRIVLHDDPVVPLSITSDSHILGYASLEEQERAGLDMSDPHMTALLLLKK